MGQVMQDACACLGGFLGRFAGEAAQGYDHVTRIPQIGNIGLPWTHGPLRQGDMGAWAGSPALYIYGHYTRKDYS